MTVIKPGTTPFNRYQAQVARHKRLLNHLLRYVIGAWASDQFWRLEKSHSECEALFNSLTEVQQKSLRPPPPKGTINEQRSQE